MAGINGSMAHLSDTLFTTSIATYALAMVGFTAEHQSGEIAVDGTEIVDARWFSIHELPLIPPRPSIARRLIDAWIDDVRAGR